MRDSRSHGLDVSLFSVGMVTLGLCAHRDDLLLPRLGGALLAVVGLALGIARDPRPLGLLGLTRLPPRRLAFIPAAAGLGVCLGLLYRTAQHRTLLPEAPTAFCLLAAAIGTCEAVAYRGFVQGSLRGHGMIPACLGATVAHTAYKCSLFVFPQGGGNANLVTLGVGTLVVGFLFSLMREMLGSSVFPVVAHVAFDIVSYGDVSDTPWWVRVSLG